MFYNLDQFLESFNNVINDLLIQLYPIVVYSRIILLAIEIDLYVNRKYESLLNNIINLIKIRIRITNNFNKTYKNFTIFIKIKSIKKYLYN